MNNLKGEKELFDRSYYEKIFHGGFELNNPPYKQKYFLKRIRDFKKEGRLLEVGFGCGIFLKYASRYFKCTGIEISKFACDEALKLVNGDSDIELYNISLEEFSTDKRFDVICCFDVLEHIPDVDSAISKIKSLLAPGGIFVMIVPVYDTLLGKVYKITDKDHTHYWKKSRSFWIEKLNFYGFNILKKEGLFRHLFFNKYYLQFGGTVYYPIMPGIFIIATRTG
jgi:2-polyprenyl-3-methyl-5-hydroxy-6-metoxy-1,4-benzoquinol methylase